MAKEKAKRKGSGAAAEDDTGYTTDKVKKKGKAEPELDEEDTEAPVTAKPKKKKRAQEEDEDEAEAATVGEEPPTKAKNKKKRKASMEEEEENVQTKGKRKKDLRAEDDEEVAAVEEEQEAPTKVKKKKASKAAAKDDVEAAPAGEETSVKPKKKKNASKLAHEEDAADAEQATVKKSRKARKAEEDEDAEVLDAEEQAVPAKRNKKTRKAPVEDEAAEPEEEPVPQKKKKAKTAADGEGDSAGAPHKAYVGDLPFSTSKDKLMDDFGKYGSIIELDLLVDQLGKSRGIAFITFESEEALQSALEMDGEKYGGRIIKVRTATGSGPRPKQETTAAASQSSKSKSGGSVRKHQLFVNGIPWSAKEADVKPLFEKFGELAFFHLPVNKRGSRDGTNKGFAFVAYTSRDAMKKALELHGSDFEGRTLVVAVEGKGENGPVAKKPRGENGEEDDDERRGGGKGSGKAKGKDKGKGKGKFFSESVVNREFEVFVGGLPWGIEDAIVRRDFEECGEINRFSMPVDEEGKTKGLAFINYTTKESMEKALEFHEKEYAGLWIRVLKSVAPKNPRAAKGTGKGLSTKDKQDEPVSSMAYCNSQGKIVESQGKKTAFEDSDDE
eukprot:TRINITY_DN35739_c0_g1_i1.p1 TRINITY_DN35739_c0_g1~~TRINITY_DN35739_c0_g1_i1.p1  ORF type:complete len:613 (-),score=212.71 TRINITY_DN35739_c0_g1_i1:506-2344(-)